MYNNYCDTKVTDLNKILLYCNPIITKANIFTFGLIGCVLQSYRRVILCSVYRQKASQENNRNVVYEHSQLSLIVCHCLMFYFPFYVTHQQSLASSFVVHNTLVQILIIDNNGFDIHVLPCTFARSVGRRGQYGNVQ